MHDLNFKCFAYLFFKVWVFEIAVESDGGVMLRYHEDYLRTVPVTEGPLHEDTVTGSY